MKAEKMLAITTPTRMPVNGPGPGTMKISVIFSGEIFASSHIFFSSAGIFGASSRLLSHEDV